MTVALPQTSQTEFEFRAFLRAHDVEYTPDVCITGYWPDLILPPSLVVEIDGSSHRTITQQKSDARRSFILSKHGYTVIRFPNRLVSRRPADVLAVIRAYQHLLSPP